MIDEFNSLADARRRAIEFIKDLHCIACEYKSECSSRYPDYLIKCRYIEKWALNSYKRVAEYQQ